jgi:hypothetical protein
LNNGKMGGGGFLDVGVQLAAELREPVAKLALDGWEQSVVAEPAADGGFAPGIASSACKKRSSDECSALTLLFLGKILLQLTLVLLTYVVGCLHGVAHE